jgi:hypothetical protein
MKGIFLKTPLGFSINHHFGFNTSISHIVLSTSFIPIRAESVFGIYALDPPAQCVPIEATENAVHGGEAQIISFPVGKLLKGIDKISQQISGFKEALLSIVSV